MFPINKATAYVDSIAMKCRYDIPHTLRNDLDAESGTCFSEKAFDPYRSAEFHRLMIHQPTTTALTVLASTFATQHSPVTRVDLALDVVPTNPDDLPKLRKFLDKHLVKRWHRKQRVITFVGTRYSAAFGAPTLLALYDSQSRMNDEAGQPCCHIEYRHYQRLSVKRLGIATTADILAFDFYRFWRSRLILEAVNYRQLGRQRTGRGRAKQPKLLTILGCEYDTDERCGRMLTRAAATSEDGPTTQDVRDRYTGCRWFRPQTSLTRLDNSWIIDRIDSTVP